MGGGGYAFDEVSVLLEEAGGSLLGPLALNCAAPDEGNIQMLRVIASPVQPERYLQPLVSGQVRSCFAMTEPAPGAGSDPGALRTTVHRAGEDCVINRRKHLITGAEGVGFTIAMAKDADGPGATMLVVDADNPDMRVVGDTRTIDSTMVGGHCEVVFEEAVVPADAVLGAPGEGFHYAGGGFGAARLTHCIR